jgi:hypothetical protein
MVEELKGVKYRERPELSVGNCRPMYCRVNHHGSRDRHYGLNRSLRNSIMVMRSCASVRVRLGEAMQVDGKLCGGKRSSIVTVVGMGDDAIVATVKLVEFFRLKCFVCVEMRLQRNPRVPGGMVDKDASSRVFLFRFFLTKGVEETAFGMADEMID